MKEESSQISEISNQKEGRGFGRAFLFWGSLKTETTEKEHRGHREGEEGGVKPPL